MSPSSSSSSRPRSRLRRSSSSPWLPSSGAASASLLAQQQQQFQAQFAWPESLLELRLYKCCLFGRLPVASLATLSQVRVLSLWGNDLSGPIPEALLKAWGPTLKELDLSENSLTGRCVCAGGGGGGGSVCQ